MICELTEQIYYCDMEKNGELYEENQKLRNTLFLRTDGVKLTKLIISIV
jgi:hypothetical protein